MYKWYQHVSDVIDNCLHLVTWIYVGFTTKTLTVTNLDSISK